VTWLRARPPAAQCAPPRLIPTAAHLTPPPLAVFVNYTVIFAGREGDDEYSVEYDCSGEGLLNNYCIHILSRRPTMAPALVAKLVNASLALNLNTQNLPFNYTRQVRAAGGGRAGLAGRVTAVGACAWGAHVRCCPFSVSRTRTRTRRRRRRGAGDGGALPPSGAGPRGRRRRRRRRLRRG
jgi:hypothetical protein